MLSLLRRLSLKDKPSDAWKSWHSVLKLKTKSIGCHFDANKLNQFVYNRFDRAFTPLVFPGSISVIFKPLLTIFNKSIRTGTFPRNWKLANIKPIPKFKGFEVKDYRPFALTPTMSKCLERLLVKHFQPLVTHNYQFAYRQHKSTEDTVILSLDTITCHLDKSAKNDIHGVYSSTLQCL